AARAEAKRRLENLNGKIDGMISLKVVTDRLPSSNADMMLDSEFETVEALAGYQTNPLHVEAATYVRSVVEARLCLDF
ncbi:MAG: Dabb family protein, partial [Clostridia bacterium]|nr:Dabb family protein [Clostridia bacterium]